MFPFDQPADQIYRSMRRWDGVGIILSDDRMKDMSLIRETRMDGGIQNE